MELTREPDEKVTLKLLHDSQNKTNEFLNEVKAYSVKTYSVEGHANDDIPKIYGISQHPDTKDYIIVLQDGYCEKCDEINKYSISGYDSVLQTYGISQNPDTKDYTLVLQDGYCEACDKFMKEIKAYSMDEDSHVLEVYGISQHPDTKDYIMVLAVIKIDNPIRDASSNVIIITEEFAKRLGLYRSWSTLCSGDQPLPRVIVIFNNTSNFCVTRYSTEELVEVQPTFPQYTLPAKNLGKAVCLPAPVTIL
ncbi:unnamed protein product [Rhizophagus irregularis]|nr:unnamed protein product [Rhizophagus irregularis]